MKLQKLTCERARNICIVETLAKLGHFPSRKTEKEAWFLSPLRSETQASFKVSLKLNRWYDFGIGEGGNIIDLVCLLSNCSVGEALQFLSDELPVFSFQGTITDTSEKECGNTIIQVKPITKSYLKKYVRSRGISLEVARSYCKEVWYECRGKSYYAIGLQNKDGGWELRSLYFKTSSSPKSYTYLQNENDNLVVCEGMFDLLSIAEIYPEELNGSDIIVLNSLSFLQQITSYFKNYTSVDLYLDNDQSGKKNAKKLFQYYPHLKDQSNRYKNYKDLNEKLACG
ncbi:DNA primase [Gramella sp. MT6]|uniref:toprim domain-containing protein n=1 Tax=Gramella sp. MT6 TaxID=2705471 RepID=UPI001C5E7296|nr:toprim domain-containing protein [Gramella sp. MT6]QYA26179.1 DNA primase [Gramella sp. MT6]|tara:strand:- start:274 stop:1125 length:852 start_codon:yes stop_codon:yes gene_type:complete